MNVCECVCVCVFHDHATTHKSCCTQCAFSTTTCAVIVTNNNAEKCVTHSDGDKYLVSKSLRR